MDAVAQHTLARLAPAGNRAGNARRASSKVAQLTQRSLSSTKQLATTIRTKCSNSSVSTSCIYVPERPLRADSPERPGKRASELDSLEFVSQSLDALDLDSIDVESPTQSPPALGGAETINQPGLNGLASSDLQGLLTGEFVVSAAQPIEYKVKEVSGMLDPSNPTLLVDIIPDTFPYQLTPHTKGLAQKRRVVIMDQNIAELYGERVTEYMKHYDVDCKIITLDAGEAHKNFDQVFRVAQEIEEWGVNRRKEPIIAIGGGVLLDIAALAANLFRRNTPIIKVPTTLMAVVDASIGVKTGVNFHQHKNKLGTYCAPLATFYDLDFLATLDARNLSNGMAEIVKMACIKDSTLFTLLEQHGAELMQNKMQNSISAATVIRRSIQGMLEELEPNLWEHILIRVVDYGHTISTRIEMDALEMDEPMLHGEAVAVDMAVTTVMALRRGLLSESECDRMFKLFKDLDLDVWHPSCTADAAWTAVEDMARARDGYQRVPLMNGIGAASFVNDITYEELEGAVAYCKVQQQAR